MNIATTDYAAREGVSGVVSIPAITVKNIKNAGQNVQNIPANGGTVVLSNPLELTTAPQKNGSAGPIRVDSTKNTK